MRNARFDGLLAGTAMALTLTLTAYSNNAFAQSARALSNAVPAPATADLPPPTAKDISPVTVTTTPAKSEAKSETPASEATSSVPGADTPKTTLAAADSAIADKLREQFAAGKFDRIVGGKKERGAIEAFYASREFAPIWITNGAMNERGKATAAYLAAVDAEGLDPADYPVPVFKAGAEADALAEAEVRLTDTVLTFARHAQTGRVHYSRISADILYTLVKSEPNEVLGKISGASNVREALDSFNPQQPGYKALKAKLAEVRNGADVNKPVIPQGPVLKYSKDKKGKEVLMEDPRVPALRRWFGIKAVDGDTNYDKTLADTIAKFQKEHGIQPSGQLTTATLDAINGPKRERTLDIIIANLERWRWMPRDLGQTHVMVNIPDFTLRVVRDHKLVWTTKIVVGKPHQATPITSAEMKFITVNPTWNVPPSIIQNEYLPALAQDPHALERIGLKIEQNRDGTVRIWQPPGERNALGRIRFNFPNKFLVYQHDTPDKHLFAHEKRAYSHGCMRVQDPLKYGEVLLSLVLPNEKYTQDRLQKMFGGSEININFPNVVPVHLTYQTAYVDDAGKLVIRDDVYGRDARMLAVLKGSERKIANVAVDLPRNNSAAPVRMAPGTYGGGGMGFGGFFERMFGGPEPAPARPRARVGRASDRDNFR
jgi:L,D-transpeptidase YcbB